MKEKKQAQSSTEFIIILAVVAIFIVVILSINGSFQGIMLGQTNRVSDNLVEGDIIITTIQFDAVFSEIEFENRLPRAIKLDGVIIEESFFDFSGVDNITIKPLQRSSANISNLSSLHLLNGQSVDVSFVVYDYLLNESYSLEQSVIYTKP